MPNKCEATKIYEDSNLPRDFEHKDPNYLPPLGQNPLGTENDQKELGKRSLAQTSLLKIASSLVVTKETATSQARLGQHLSGGLF